MSKKQHLVESLVESLVEMAGTSKEMFQSFLSLHHTFHSSTDPQGIPEIPGQFLVTFITFIVFIYVCVVIIVTWMIIII